MYFPTGLVIYETGRCKITLRRLGIFHHSFFIRKIGLNWYFGPNFIKILLNVITPSMRRTTADIQDTISVVVRNLMAVPRLTLRCCCSTSDTEKYKKF